MGHTVYVLRRRADLSRAQFQQYWRDVHGPLVARHAATLGIVRYVQLHTPEAAASSDALRGPMAEPYDGVAELWWNRELATTDEALRQAALRALVEDERNFIDLGRSSKWFSRDYTFVDGALPDESIVVEQHSPRQQDPRASS